MATPKNPFTPELAERLYRGVSRIFAAAVILGLGFVFVSLIAFGVAGPVAVLGIAIPGIFLGLIVSGLSMIRSALFDYANGVTAPAKKASYGETPRQEAVEPAVPAYEAPPISAPRPARSAVEPPAAVFARSQPSAAPQKKKAVPAKPAASAVEWEEWVGQKLLQKVGIVIVLIGMLVLLQQAFENRWIDELGRVFIALVASAALLGAGEFFQKKYDQWSHGFTGGGLFLAYLSVWVAHVHYADALARDYQLVIPAGVAFALYAAITAAGVLLSVRYKAQTVAWFAIAGGYLTPLLVDAAQPDPYVFSVYLGILAAGLLMLSYYRSWQGIALASFALTQFYLASAVYPSELLSNGVQACIAVAFFAIFASLPLVRHFRQKTQSSPEDLLLIVGNAASVFLAVQDALGGWQSEYVAMVCIALAAFTVACSVLALRVRREDAAIGDTYLLGSIALIALALYHQLGWEWLAIGWAPYAALTLHVAARLRRRSVWASSNLLLAGAVMSLMTQMPITPTLEASWRPFLSNWSLQSYVMFASLLAMLPAVRRMPKEFTGEVHVDGVLHAFIAILTFGLITFEVTALQWASSVPLSLAYLAFAAVAVAAFVATRQIVWFVTALGMQVIVFIFAFLRGDDLGMDVFSLLDQPNASQFPLVHPWAFVSVLATLSLVGLLALSQRGDEHPLLPRVHVRHLLLGMIAAQVWLHVSVEIRHVATWFDWSRMDYNRALSAWWLLFGAFIARVAWTPQWRNAAVLLLALPFVKDAFRIMEGDATMLDTIAWTLLSLGTASYGAFARRRELLVAGAVGLLGTGAADMLTHLSHNDAGLLRSVWWAVAGLLSMIAGFACRDKLLRQVSLAIFAATVAKLLFVDFSLLETPVRIVASIATGLLLIGASYLYQRYGTPQGDR